MDNKFPESPEQGFFALVAYIPDPLGSFLNSLRDALPGDENPQAHITILPPRPLQVSVNSASSEAQRILGHFPAFLVQLSDVRAFPETNVLYLAIKQGRETIHRLHDALNTGILAHDEDFEFMPHLTISGPVDSRVLARVLNDAQKSWTSRDSTETFQIAEVVGLWQTRKDPRKWNRVWSFRLAQEGSSAASVS